MGYRVYIDTCSLCGVQSRRLEEQYRLPGWTYMATMGRQPKNSKHYAACPACTKKLVVSLKAIKSGRKNAKSV